MLDWTCRGYRRYGWSIVTTGPSDSRRPSSRSGVSRVATALGQTGLAGCRLWLATSNRRRLLGTLLSTRTRYRSRSRPPQRSRGVPPTMAAEPEQHEHWLLLIP